MRKKLIFSFIVTVCVVMLSFACVKTDTVKNTTQISENKTVMTVSQSEFTNDKALESRFLNMLNHSFVYNQEFYDDYALVNQSVLGVLDLAENGFVDEVVLADYIYNMYGKIYNDFSFLDEELPKQEGYVYVIPRGYLVYSHELVSMTNNNDGSFTVISKVQISDIDGSVEELECETVFLENSDSAFGYNIMYSEFFEAVFEEFDC